MSLSEKQVEVSPSGRERETGELFPLAQTHHIGPHMPPAFSYCDPVTVEALLCSQALLKVEFVCIVSGRTVLCERESMHAMCVCVSVLGSRGCHGGQ